MTPKVLLVDDVAMFLELQKGFLKLSPVQVLTARDGAEALALARTERPDLLFMDLHMPAMDGADCCRRIKADPALKKTPVVMVTTAGKEEDLVRCREAGCDGYLYKPLDRVQFLEVARRFIPRIDRRDVRVPCSARAKFRVYGVTFSGVLVDLSEHGAYLAADFDVEKDTVVELVFALPGEGGATIQCKGRVAWVNTTKSCQKFNLPPGFGVEFTAVTSESAAALACYVREKAARK